jgi:hypothetical protein
MIVPFGVYQLPKFVPVAGANRPNVYGLVIFTVEFGATKALFRGSRFFGRYHKRTPEAAIRR